MFSFINHNGPNLRFLAAGFEKKFRQTPNEWTSLHGICSAPSSAPIVSKIFRLAEPKRRLSGHGSKRGVFYSLQGRPLYSNHEAGFFMKKIVGEKFMHIFC